MSMDWRLEADFFQPFATHRSVLEHLARLTESTGVELPVVPALLVISTAAMLNEFKHPHGLRPAGQVFFRHKIIESCGKSAMAIHYLRYYVEQGATAGEASIRSNEAAQAGLDQMAQQLDPSRWLWCGRGELSSQLPPRTVHSAILRLVGCLVLFQMRDALTSLLGKLSSATGAKKPVRDYKTPLQTVTQSRFRQTPRYEIVSQSGPTHSMQWIMRVSAGGKSATGSGLSKKKAAQDAARQLLLSLGEVPSLEKNREINPAAWRLDPPNEFRIHEVAAEDMAARTGLKVNSQILAAVALTHASYSNEVGLAAQWSYGSLAVLGAAVYQMLCSHYQAETWPGDADFYFSRIATVRLMKEQSVAKSATEHGVDSCVRVGKGQRSQGVVAGISANALQAWIGAHYLENADKPTPLWLSAAPLVRWTIAELDAARQLPLHELRRETDPNTLLQETAEVLGLAATFDDGRRSMGLPTTYTCRLTLSAAGESYSFSATGPSKIVSREKASTVALSAIFALSEGPEAMARAIDIGSPSAQRCVRWLARIVVGTAEHAAPADWERFSRLGLLGLSEWSDLTDPDADTYLTRLAQALQSFGVEQDLL